MPAAGTGDTQQPTAYLTDAPSAGGEEWSFGTLYGRLQGPETRVTQKWWKPYPPWAPGPEDCASLSTGLSHFSISHFYGL